MMRLLGLIFALAVLGLPAFAQNPDNVSFVLAIKEGKTSFRIGEEIDLEFRFSAQAVQRYAKEQSCYPTRRTTFISADEFVVEPRIGLVDPLTNSTTLIWGGLGSCLTGAPQYLNATPWIQDRILNEWIEFRQPGRYRITAKSSHQVSGSQGPTPLVLQSNAVEIEIVAPEPGWAEKQVQEAIAVLKSSRNEDEIFRAGRTLRFLESAEVVPALVEYFDRSHAGDELRLGLISSPYQKEILARLDAQLVAPDFPITESWFRTYADLKTVAAKGPPPKPTAGALSQERSAENLQAGRLWTAELNAYYGPGIESRRPSLTAASNALPQKQGQARVVTLKTLLIFGGRPPDESVRRAVIASFTVLPDGDQDRLLGQWELWAGPDAHAAILESAKGSGRARDAALIHLMEFSVDEARQVIVDRVRRGDGISSQELLMLPDKTIPELDGVLATAYEQGRPVDRLIARYATDQVFDRVRIAFEKRPPDCGEILAYFYRVNPRAAQAYRNAVLPKCIFRFESPVPQSPGLEQAAIEDLASSTPGLLLPALRLLERGSQKAADALWKALEQSNQDPFVTNQIVYTLRKPGDWFFTPEQLDRMKTVCAANSCGQGTKSFAESLTSPVPIRLDSSSTAVGLERIHIGPFEASDREETLEIIQRFPAGTHFRLMLPLGIAPWFYQRRLDEINAAFKTAGIEIDKSP